MTRKIKNIITSESVNIGHPDKTCDYIADSFLDEALSQDPESQMAVECAIKDNLLMIYGEATTDAKINYKKIGRKALKNIGYKNRFKVKVKVSEQSLEINEAVVKDVVCANDQGIVYGYASDETSNYMPLTIELAHALMAEYELFRRKGKTFFPDAKSQVSVEYDAKGNPKKIDTILISVSHSNKTDLENIQDEIFKNVIQKVTNRPEYIGYIKDNTNIIINPSGKFTVWGSFSDSGCVGRKIVVDTYGGVGRVGGGCFSSKNPTKVDRSAAYYARYVAKNIVANGFAKKCEIQVSYGIGMEEPISISVNASGLGKYRTADIYRIIEENFDFSPENIIRELDLKKPIYSKTACYGHFGRKEFNWEKIKKIEKSM